MTFQDKRLYEVCIETESLYNQLVQASFESNYEEIIAKLKPEYELCLSYLNYKGIGRVMINGTFRYTNKENCPDA
jgi:hypothetical protein